MRTKKRTKSIVGIIFAFVSILYAFTGAVFALRRDNSSRKGLSGRIDVNLTAGKAKRGGDCRHVGIRRQKIRNRNAR